MVMYSWPYPVSHVSLVEPGVSASLLVPANADRVCLSVQNVGAVDVYVSNDPAVAASGAHQGRVIKGGQTPPDEWVHPWGKGPVSIVAAGAGAVVVLDDVHPE